MANCDDNITHMGVKSFYRSACWVEISADDIQKCFSYLLFFFFQKKRAKTRRQSAWNVKVLFLRKIICRLLNYCPFDITWKDDFCLAWYILCWLTISYQKLFVFSVSVLCSQICTLKLNLRPNISLTYGISIIKRFFWIFVWEYIFYFSLLKLNYWCFTTILW